MVADKLTGGVLQTLHAADVDTHRGVVLQSAAAGGHLRVAVHDAHLLTQLVDEHADRVGLADDAGQLTHGLTHQTCLQAHMAVAHLALDLSAGHHSGYRVHYDGINGTGAHQCFADLHGLLAGVRLADQQVVDVHAQRLGIGGVQCVLNVDKGHLAALLLGFGKDVQRQRGLTAGFRAVHLDDAAARHTAHAQRQIQPQTASRDGIHLHGGVVAQLHDGTLAELLFDLRQRRSQRVLLGLRLGLLGGRCNVVVLIFCHSLLLLLSFGPAEGGLSFAFLLSITQNQNITTRSCLFFPIYFGRRAVTQRSLPPKS